MNGTRIYRVETIANREQAIKPDEEATELAEDFAPSAGVELVEELEEVEGVALAPVEAGAVELAGCKVTPAWAQLLSPQARAVARSSPVHELA